MLGSGRTGPGIRCVARRPLAALRARVHHERREATGRIQRVRRRQIAAAAVADEGNATRQGLVVAAGGPEVPGSDRVAVRAAEGDIEGGKLAVRVALERLDHRLARGGVCGRDRACPEGVESRQARAQPSGIARARRAGDRRAGTAYSNGRHIDAPSLPQRSLDHGAQRARAADRSTSRRHHCGPPCSPRGSTGPAMRPHVRRNERARRPRLRPAGDPRTRHRRATPLRRADRRARHRAQPVRRR